MSHSVNDLLDSSMQNLRKLVDVNTIIGDPINIPDGTTIIPVSKVTFGFGSGGSDFAAPKEKEQDFFGGGSGAGVTIQPLAFLVVKNGTVQLLQLASQGNTADRVVNMVPEVMDKITGIFSKNTASPVSGAAAPAPAPAEN